MLPETLILEVLNDDSFNAFTVLPDLTEWGEYDDFVLIDRVGTTIDNLSFERGIGSKPYSFGIQCFSSVSGGESSARLSAYEYALEVEKSISDVYLKPGVLGCEFYSQSDLPEMNGFAGVSLSLTLQLEK